MTRNDPSTSQNKNVIEAMINMMDETPWIERYAVYGNVEWFRDTHYDDGSLTSRWARCIRRIRAPMAYTQAIKGNRARVASYYFDGDCADASGCGNDGMEVNVPTFANGKHGEALELDGENSYVQLPGDIASSASFSFAAWIYWDGGASNQRIFDFGSFDRTQYMVLSPKNPDGALGFALKNGGSTSWLSCSEPMPTGSWQHVAVTKNSSTVKIYLNGSLQASGSISVSTLSGTLYNYLGKSQWPSDPLFDGKMDDLHIANYAYSAEEISNLMANTMQMQLSTNLVDGGEVVPGEAYSGSVAGTASDADDGAISYYKIYGPDWLTVATDGTLSGTPGSSVDGAQLFTIRAYDSTGERRHFSLQIMCDCGSGTWIDNSSGYWHDETKWLGNFPAHGIGKTADFSTVDISVNRTVRAATSDQTVGALAFADVSGTRCWDPEIGWRKSDVGFGIFGCTGN